MKFIAQMTGQVAIMQDGTRYKADRRIIDVAAHHASEMSSQGFIKHDSAHEVQPEAPAPVSVPQDEAVEETHSPVGRVKRAYRRRSVEG